MEGLMSEATDLILSPRRSVVMGPNKILKWESGNIQDSPQDSTSLTSVTLLRLSITNSIKDRRIETEEPDEETSKPNKNKRRREPCTRKPKVDIQLLNSELATFYPERKESVDEKDSPIEQDKPNITTKAFTELLNNKQTHDAEIFDSPETQETKTENYKKNEITLDDEEQKKRKKMAQNGMKLASRKFSDGIFENCSTYSLACPEVLHERENFTPPKQDLAANDQPLAENLPTTNDYDRSDDKKNSAAEIDSCSEDQISLSDSFFVDVTSEEYAPENYFFQKEVQKTSENKNSVRGYSNRGNDLTMSEDSTCSSGSQRRERRLSKKLRKRNKKSKSKDVPAYECPKCGVLYILSTKTSESTARCLHCDFWTSVEPEFVKREKQPWNTCRIC